MTAKQRKESLAEMLRANKASLEAEEAERQKLSAQRHAIFLEGFRKSLSRCDHLTGEEKAKIIKPSCEW